MADVEMKEAGGGRHQGTKSKKLSTRIDMTPMVDVAFLLITFFMLTTTLQKPKTMNLYLPEDVKNPEEQNKVKESQALTIILGKDHQVYYYYGTGQEPNERMYKTTFANKGGIRDVIINKWDNVIKNSGGRDSLVAIIKPMNDADYEDVVNILDEMNINGVQKYALVDSIYDFEKNLMKEADDHPAPDPTLSGQ
ncbi:outer membrane transport energization protein ExbD [Thermoflavifilum aggregans]|uniref:Outer membrane transport energization protein ExbD n=1 Tax=Thermoflavifilum aggregans TaxID=454188 RepID=A0A2M9CX38_9BACT|nr:biopolymer transporter ExbD [Thermoflavifilum aggregans]PJJ76471.1 outer membrane transport energization protein ExbD [Thermoflavifilum aggregans]